MGSQGEIFEIHDTGDVIEDVVLRSGVLPAGDYVLDVRFYAGHWEGIWARSEFELVFGAVPEPCSTALVAMGLLAVALRVPSNLH